MSRNHFPSGEQYFQSLIEHEAFRLRNEFIYGQSVILGTCLSVLFRISTCHDKCRHGDHILENLSGRLYNHASSSITLIRLGFYDEAFSLIRNVGEIANLLAFLRLNPSEYPNWVNSSRKERRTTFGPASIRKAIVDAGFFEPPMDEETYRNLCELATHPTGRTVPNSFNDFETKHVGGFPQTQGEKTALDKLTNSLAHVTMLVADMVERKDLLREVRLLFNDEKWTFPGEPTK